MVEVNALRDVPMAQWAQRFFERTRELFVVLGADGQLLQANPAWSDGVGWPPEALKDKHYRDFVHPEDVERMEAGLQARPDGSGLAAFSCRWRCQDGAWRWLSWSVSLSREDGLRYCSARVGEAPAEGLEVESLRRSERSFRRLIERSPDGVFVHRDRRFIYVNAALLRALGYEHERELLGRSIWDIVHPDDLELVRQRVHAVTVEGRSVPLRELRYLRRDGTWYDAESAGLAIEFDGAQAVVVMARDITERKQMQARLLQSDRMALVGTLAAGVGHEINNPLTYVLANLNMALDFLKVLGGACTYALPRVPEVAEGLGTWRELEELLRESCEGATRVRNIVRDLKSFSRQEVERRTLVDVREPLEFSIKMASSELRHRTQLIKEFQPVPPVYADPSRLGQVFLNLLVNAAQAIPEGNVAANHVIVRVRPAAPGQLAIEVADTGVGIPPELLARIFDPFFTTKQQGAGTGLGLSICHGIIRDLGGELTVRSEVGRGTTFTVLLPTASAPATAVPKPVAPAPGTRPGRRILIIDDEPSVGRSFARLLGRKYQVTVLESGKEALARLESGESFDVIFCDLMMPDATGMDLHERMLEVRPALAERFVFITGGAFTPRARQFLEKVPERWLEKPFDLQALHQMLARVLGPA